MSDYPACVLCASKRRDADVGLLCRHHLERLAAMLWEVEEQAALLDTRPSMMIRSGRGSSLASHRSPAVLDAIVATDPRRGTGRIMEHDADPWGIDDTASVLDTLHSWARIVREERQLTDVGPVTVVGERALLSKHLDWCAAQPWIDDCFHDLRKLVGQLHATNHTTADAPAGRCYLPTDNGPCEGRILRREEQAQPWMPLADRCVRVPATVTDGLAYCDRCGAEWEPDAVVRFVIALDEQRREDARPRTVDGRPMMTMTELVAAYGGTENAIRIRLSRAGVKAVEGHYDPAVLERMAA
jgi:hypothetical protein